MDLELALNLAKIDEENSESDEALEAVHETRPNVEEWINGKTPWDRSDNEVACTSKINLYPDITQSNHDQVTIPQITKILSRQSVPKDLPYFDGNPLDWPNFIYKFHNSNAICGFSNEENQCRLQKCLKGNAKKITQSLLIMPTNVQKVIDLLEFRFGRT